MKEAERGLAGLKSLQAVKSLNRWSVNIRWVQYQCLLMLPTYIRLTHPYTRATNIFSHWAKCDGRVIPQPETSDAWGWSLPRSSSATPGAQSHKMAQALPDPSRPWCLDIKIILPSYQNYLTPCIRGLSNQWSGHITHGLMVLLPHTKL